MKVTVMHHDGMPMAIAWPLLKEGVALWLRP